MLDPDLVGLWHLDGNWGDSSGNNNHAIAYNGATFSDIKIKGSFAGGFDGSDDYLQGTTSGFPLGSSARTILAWIKTGDSSGDQAIFQYGSSSQGFQLIVRDGKARVGSGSEIILANTLVTDNNWHLLAAVYEGPSTNIARIYVDGIEQNSGVITTPATTGQIFTVAGFLAGGGQFNGLIDEVAIYKRALTTEEIAFQHATGVSAPGAPVPPTLNTLPAFTGASSIAIAGAKPAGTSIWINGKKTAALDGLTTWSGTYTPLQPGHNILEVAAMDSANRLSPLVITRIFYDNITPVMESSSPANNSECARPVSTVTITFYDVGSGVNPAASITGATVKNSAGQSLSGSWSASGARSIVFTPSTPLTSNTFTLWVQPVDGVGNKGSASFSFTVDKTAPTVQTFTMPEGDYPINIALPITVPVTLAASDNLLLDALCLTEAGNPGSCAWTSTPPDQFTFGSYGPHNLYAFARDAAGNVSAGLPARSMTIQPTASLGVVTTGTGGGSITSSPAGILCNYPPVTGDCSAEFPFNSTVSLLPYPDVNSVLTTWSGACSGAGACSVNMTGNLEVTATLNYVEPVQLACATPPKRYTLLQQAYDEAPSGCLIQVRMTNLNENLALNAPKSVTIRGGYDTSFAKVIGMTGLKGKLSILKGRVAVENLGFR